MKTMGMLLLMSTCALADTTSGNTRLTAGDANPPAQVADIYGTPGARMVDGGGGGTFSGNGGNTCVLIGNFSGTNIWAGQCVSDFRNSVPAGGQPQNSNPTGTTFPGGGQYSPDTKK
jgi:hypothetical protein